jgi:hypothetical protein
MAPASELASDLVVNQLPALATRLRNYDEQNFQLQLRHDNLEEEIARVRRSIAHKQSQQVRFVEQLSYKDLAKGSLKRQRTEGGHCILRGADRSCLLIIVGCNRRARASDVAAPSRRLQ